MGKRFYVVLFSALCISLLLLGFSFSKESGSNDIADMVEIKNDDYRVVYSNNQRLDTIDNNQVDFSVINKSENKAVFYLYLNEINEKKYTDVYYVLNDSEEQLLSSRGIRLEELNSFGVDGDHANYSFKIYSKSDNNLSFKLDVKQIDMRLLSNKILMSDQVYRDIKGNLLYYGENVNNYLKYNDEVYRILGVMDGKIKYISEATNLSVYSPFNNNYLTAESYIRSFSSDALFTEKDIVNQKSWLADGKEYWLLDSDEFNASYVSEDYSIGSAFKKANYYVREVYEIEDALVVQGEGTLDNPYEVSYGS